MTRARFLAFAALLTAAVVTPAHAAKDVFIRTKPHVNVGTYQGQPADIWFHANFGIFEDGAASGIVQLRLDSGEMFIFRVIQGTALFDSEELREVMLVLQRVGPDGGVPSAPAILILRPDSAAADCLIYDIVGPNVHLSGEIEARPQLPRAPAVNTDPGGPSVAGGRKSPSRAGVDPQKREVLHQGWSNPHSRRLAAGVTASAALAVFGAGVPLA